MRNSKYIKEIEVKLVNKTPLRVGNGKESMDILVDKSTNNPLILGSSIAGAFKNYLHNIGETNIGKVFGNEEQNSDNNSKIYVFDAAGDKLDIYSRTGIARDNEYGTATHGAIYDLVMLNEGTNFNCRFKIFADDIEELELSDRYISLAINGIMTNNIRLGSKKTSGYGAFEVVEVKEKEFDLSSKQDLKDYILSNKEYTTVDMSKFTKLSSYKDFVKFTFKGSIKDSMIIKEYNQNSDIDCESLKNKDRYIIPGTTIKGLCRSYSTKILKTLDIDESIIQDIYGSDRKDKGDKKAMGRLFAQDAVIENSKECTYNRIKVDRFTGGVMEGGKFDEKRINGDVQFELSFKKTDNEVTNNNCIALTTLFLRDLALSKLVIGSSSNIGSGRFEGDMITIEDNDKKVEIRFDNDNMSISDSEYITNMINSLQKVKGDN